MVIIASLALHGARGSARLIGHMTERCLANKAEPNLNKIAIVPIAVIFVHLAFIFKIVVANF